MQSQNTEGAHSAYFTKIGYPATTYQGEVCYLSFTVYNKNCTTTAKSNASFYFMFYLDRDFWWSEYNNTAYKTWQCNAGSSVRLGYNLPPLDTIKPTVHDLRIELYWYEGYESQLQDVIFFPISIAVHIELNSLIISSYVGIFIIALLFLGFYMLINGPIQIFSSPQNITSVSGEQPIRTVGFLSELRSRPFVFYLFVLASWQMINVLFYTFSLPEELQPTVYLIAQIAYITILISLIGKEGLKFEEYGFLWPEETLKYVVVSLFLATWYSFVVIIVPGIFAGFDVFPSAPIEEVFSMILLSLVASLTAEAIFRGYIQSKLTKLGGFPRALIVTSVMFTLYTLNYLSSDLFRLPFEVLSLITMSVFIGAFFNRTKTLLSPMIFYFATSMLSSLVPVRSLVSEYLSLFLGCIALATSYILLSVLFLKKEPAVSEDEKMFLEEM
jgi:membrane protease YdiL (CAAX protease family)